MTHDKYDTDILKTLKSIDLSMVMVQTRSVNGKI